MDYLLSVEPPVSFVLLTLVASGEGPLGAALFVGVIVVALPLRSDFDKFSSFSGGCLLSV